VRSLLFSLIICGILVTLVGCGDDIRTENSEVMKETAIVLELICTPATRKEVIEPSFVGSGMIGFGPSGVGLRVGSGVQISSVGNPAEYAVVFRCQHGEFIVQRKDTYDKFKDCRGDTVEVSYQEVYRVTYGQKDHKSPPIAVERVLVKYHFIDAKLKKSNEKNGKTTLY
jgi:hypothetical protein